MIHVMTREEMRERARRAVATWPPLTSEQRDKLWILFGPMREHIAAQLAAEAAVVREIEVGS